MIKEKLKLKYHVCKVCRKSFLCMANLCYVPDDECGADHGVHTVAPETA